MSMFRKAQRSKAKLRLALCGPSGSGKTYSALLLAHGIANGGRIAMIDTERGSGELYADLTEYDVAPVDAPFSPQKYISTIKGAAAAGYDVLIIDSLTHAWAGEGGMLELADKATKASRSGNSFMAWREVTPQHNALVDAILNSPCHVIVTMRTKTAYEVVEDNGKKKPVKIGLAPVQREGMEYEFTAVLDLSVEGHIATASKDRTGLFDGKHEVPSAQMGVDLLAWLNTGTDAPPPAPAPTSTPAPEADQDRLLTALKNAATDTALSGDSATAVERLRTWWTQAEADIARLDPARKAELATWCKNGAEPF